VAKLCRWHRQSAFALLANAASYSAAEDLQRTQMAESLSKHGSCRYSADRADKEREWRFSLATNLPAA
jgi:hypothetical protein